MNASRVRSELKKYANPARKKTNEWFFKTGKGQYGEGDMFLGVRVPVIRKVARISRAMPLDEVDTLLKSRYHEERLLALIILSEKYPRGTDTKKKAIYDLYMRRLASINNWDLVDSSAHKIVGAFLMERNRRILYKLARENNLWKRRIAIMSTLHFIVRDDYADTLAIAEILLQDKEDLIHKAVGWMLREVGNRNREIEEEFLKKYYRIMPRTMLRYAIEKFPETLRQDYLK